MVSQLRLASRKTLLITVLAAINDIRVRNFEYRLPVEVTELDANVNSQKQAFSLAS